YFAATVPVTTRTFSDWWLKMIFGLESKTYPFTSMFPALTLEQANRAAVLNWTPLIGPLLTLLALGVVVFHSAKTFHPPRKNAFSADQVLWRTWPGAALLSLFLLLELLAVKTPSSLFTENMLVLI